MLLILIFTHLVKCKNKLFIDLIHSYFKNDQIKVFNLIKFERNKKLNKITFDELSKLFILFLAAFAFLFVVFIIECIYYKFNEYLS